MNKTFFKIGVVAASLLALFACNRQEIDLANEPEQEMVTFTFTAEKPVEETRTASVEGNSSASYIWTDEDIQNLKLFQVTPDQQYGEVETQISAENLTVTRPSDTKLVVTASVAAADSYTFRAKLSKDLTSGRHVKVPKNQYPETTTYDPDADVLVSDDLTCSSPTDLALVFSRKAVINKMTLKGLTSGEKVQKVIISSDKYLTGYYNGSAWTGQEKGITLAYNDEVVGSNGQFPVYFVSMPNTGHTLSVYVITDTHTYSKAAFGNGSIALNQGYFTRFGVTLPAGTALADPSGMYLIGSYVSGRWILMSNEVKSNYYIHSETQVSTAAANVDFSEFSDIADIDDYVWTFAADDGGYCIRNYITSDYLSLTTNGNYAEATPNLEHTNHSTTFGVVYDRSTKEATVTSQRFNTRQLMYNSNQPRFAFYTGTLQPIYLIPAMIDPRTKVTLSFSESIINRTTSTFASFTGMTPTANPNVSAITSNITYSWSGDAIGSVAPSTGVVTLNGSAGNATVTASFAGDQNYRSATASYQIIVSSDSGPQWVLIESASDVVEGEYVITWNNTYYLPNTSIGSRPSAVSGITVNDNKLTNVVTDAMIWEFDGNNSDGFTISAEITTSSSTHYLMSNGDSTTGLQIDNNQNSPSHWKALDNSDYGMLLKSGSINRYPAVYENTDWRYYNTGNYYNGRLRLYKKEFNDGKTDAGISYSPNQATITFGDNLTQPTFNNPNVLTGITYQSDDITVATVDASTGVITVVGAGSATITASWNDETIGGVTYRAGTADYELTVNKATPVIAAFNNPTTTVAVGGTVTNTTTISNNLTITYTSSDPTIASVNSNTGVVTGLQNGYVTISATFGGNANYNAATPKSYSLTVGTVSDPNPVVFTAGTDTGATSVTKSGITVSMSTMSRTDNYRTYANSNMTVTAAGGKTITQVKVTCTGEGKGDYGPGKFSGNDYSYSGSIGTWSGNAASSVSLHASAQVRMTKIEVTWQ